MKLISMTSFVLEQVKIKQSTSEFKEVIKNYANFLKQPLELWMFVPCDENGNVLLDGVNWNENFYKKAKDRVLFEGFEKALGRDKIFTDYKGNILGLHENNIFSFRGKTIFTIEDLIQYNLTLSQTALKQL